MALMYAICVAVPVLVALWGCVEWQNTDDEPYREHFKVPRPANDN